MQQLLGVDPVVTLYGFGMVWGLVWDKDLGERNDKVAVSRQGASTGTRGFSTELRPQVIVTSNPKIKF